ncbi:MAG: hypothetical protein QXX79_02680, partial [Candidatus Bathyarchaeia archaeon]
NEDENNLLEIEKEGMRGRNLHEVSVSIIMTHILSGIPLFFEGDGFIVCVLLRKVRTLKKDFQLATPMSFETWRA